MKTAASREPYLVLLLVAVTIFALDQYQMKRAAQTTSIELRGTMRRHMSPLVQYPPFAPSMPALAGHICISDGCIIEMEGWRWAASKRVTNQGECYGIDSAYSLGLASGCNAYIEAMQLPKVPDS